MGTDEKQFSNIQISRHAILAEAFEIFSNGLTNFIDTQMNQYFSSDSWVSLASKKLGRPTDSGSSDPYFQLLVLRRFWGPVFSNVYDQDLRPIINELIETRNLWAHFSLPDDIDQLDRSVLIMERILSPVNPDFAIEIRRRREMLKLPFNTQLNNTLEKVDINKLEKELKQSSELFEQLQSENDKLYGELSASRAVTESKQNKLTILENQLNIIQGRSIALETFLSDERRKRNRIEWLFIGFITAIMIFAVIFLK